MICEKIVNTNIMFCYTNKEMEWDVLNQLKQHNVLVSSEQINKMHIYKFHSHRFFCLPLLLKDFDFKFRCLHGKDIFIDRYNKLPHDNWQELIDHWSCHKSEFKTVNKLKCEFFPSRILCSDFYCIFYKKDLPECCQTKNLEESQKMFYNELYTGHNSDYFIYKFFEDCFNRFYSFSLKLKGDIYEFKSFGTCILEKNSNENNIAFKIGFKTSNKHDHISEINEYFENEIFLQINKNKLNIKVCNYDISFIEHNFNR
ncbi:hypothetical protein EHP00_38 [Ecytonucleospora hepatopenaei]|uniref:Uncharacterized protein n=1 Tax=Ecytonucleospora hepatopenaei TaxID=646526 RepID=A0A1W0E5R6_9MICR|nr:hypothetical protein EHP00_38 [Ecytonucleospora hepatopenaei]